MTVSHPFYVIQARGVYPEPSFFDAPSGSWSLPVDNVRRYATPERADADASEFDLCSRALLGDRIEIAPYVANIGHNGQTVILPS